jgi:hypothetical protein
LGIHPDLKAQGLNREEIYNIWFDKLAKQYWASSDEPEQEPDPTPMEKWAVYSSYPALHKIIGSLTEGIYSCLGYRPLLQYVSKKHNLSIHHMDLINLHALHGFL